MSHPDGAGDIAFSRLDGPLDSGDGDHLATLHGNSLADGILTLMGGFYLRRFYAFLAKSPLETIFVGRAGGRIVALCVITWGEETVLARAVTATWPWFAAAAAGRFIVSGPFRRACAGVLRSGRRSSHKPQILLLYTDPARTGEGIGGRLLGFVESALAEERVLYSKTDGGTDNRAITFYQRHGFTVDERFDYAGRPYMRLKKTLTQREISDADVVTGGKE
jgi:GNAT superfamily N-acetyltransferase